MTKYFSLTVLVCFLAFTAHAQQSTLGSWNILNIKYSYTSRLSFFAEAQIRSLKFYNDFHYYEYKGGLNLEAAKGMRVSLGAGSYQTYREGGDFRLPKNNDEFRLWPQLVFTQAVGKIKIEQRYRSELRFTSNGYRNRFRYRVGGLYSFGKLKNGTKPFQLSASNELFFTDKEPYFERNRWLLAFNYKLSTTTTVQLGYLHQFDYKINDEIGRDFLQLGIFIELFRRQNTNTTSEIEVQDN